MNKTDLANELAARTGITKSKALTITNAALDILAEVLERKETVQLQNFGSFEPKLTPGRVARNPKNNEEVMLPECYRIWFKSAKQLKRKVNGEHP